MKKKESGCIKIQTGKEEQEYVWAGFRSQLIARIVV